MKKSKKSWKLPLWIALLPEARLSWLRRTLWGNAPPADVTLRKMLIKKGNKSLTNVFRLEGKNKIYRDLTWRLFTHFSSQFGKQKENRKITLQLRINTNSTYLFQKSHTICRLLFIIIFTAKSPKIAKKKSINHHMK